MGLSIVSLPVIAISNESTVLSDAQLQAVIPALQKQVTNDFRAFYSIDATLEWLPHGAALTPGWWQIVVLDDPDQAGALGYHELSSQGTPLGKVFAKLGIENKSSWTITISHELLEMLGDPDINLCAQSDDGRIFAYEVCDPVEADNLGYFIDDVLVSDFVTPKWFQPSAFGSVYSFKENIKGPYQIAIDGYISVYDGRSASWHQISGRGRYQMTGDATGDIYCATTLSKVTHPIPVGSRRSRRSLHKSDWQRSAR